MGKARSLAALLLSPVLVVALSAPALAGGAVDPNGGDDVVGRAGPLRYSSDRSRFDAGADGFAETHVGCGGPRWHLIGGGAATGGSGTQAWLSFGRPFDGPDADDTGDDGWYTGGFGPDGARVTGYSICIRATSLRYRFRVKADAPSGERRSSVMCGGPRWRTTSGSPLIAATGSWINASIPRDGSDAGNTPDDGWRGTAHDTAAGTGLFSMHVVCARDVRLRYAKRPAVGVPSGEPVVRRVPCRRSEHVVGGGGRISGPADQGRLVVSAPYDGRDPGRVPDDGWRVRAYNVGGADKSLTAFAICLR
jgi:hypothetical protein